jgi:hypothetical protein
MGYERDWESMGCGAAAVVWTWATSAQMRLAIPGHVASTNESRSSRTAVGWSVIDEWLLGWSSLRLIVVSERLVGLHPPFTVRTTVHLP